MEFNKKSFYFKTEKEVIDYYNKAISVIRSNMQNGEGKLIAIVAELLLRAECRELLKNIDIPLRDRPEPSDGQSIII